MKGVELEVGGLDVARALHKAVAGRHFANRYRWPGVRCTFSPGSSHGQSASDPQDLPSNETDKNARADVKWNTQNIAIKTGLFADA